jgi:hypothetical protein
VGTNGQVLTADSAETTGVKWSAAPNASALVELRNPQQSANPGNVWPTVETLTAWEAWHWQFLKDVDGKLFGIVRVGVGYSAPKIRLVCFWNATTGVARLSIAWAAVADGASLNPASLTAITAQDITVPATARLRKNVDFAIGSALNEGDTLLLSIYHEGAHANDTVAVNTQLLAAYLLPV